MEYTHIKFNEFLQKNGISSYFLHRSIKKEMANFKNQVVIFNSTIASDEFRADYWNDLEQTDEKILTSIQNYLITKVRKKATNDKEILIALKRLKWTKEIHETALRKMGVQASLFWNTTILGKLKLVRVGDYIPIYYVIPFGKKLKLKEVIEPHKVIQHAIIEEPA